MDGCRIGEEGTSPEKTDHGSRSNVLPFAALLSQRFQFVHELVDVLELPIDGGKSDIGDLVQLVQLLHDFFPHDPTFNLRFAHLLNPFFYPIGDGFDSPGADRPLFARFLHSGEDLGAVERLASAVFFHDDGQNFLDAFVGGVAAFTAKTLAPAADDLAFLGHARIDDFVFEFITERTFHRRRPCSLAIGWLVGMKDGKSGAQRFGLCTNFFEHRRVLPVLKDAVD